MSVPTPASNLPSFGRIVVEKGLASTEAVHRCVKIQDVRAKRGDFVRLGQILVEEGILSTDQVQRVLGSQELRILVCDRCGTQFNYTSSQGKAPSACVRCGGALGEPDVPLHTNHALTERLIASPQVDHVVFTGSVEAGRSVQRAVAERFIGVGLEARI